MDDHGFDGRHRADGGTPGGSRPAGGSFIPTGLGTSSDNPSADRQSPAGPASVVVAIPARDEAERIDRCLAALHAQVGAPHFRVVLLANNCTDDTVPIAQAWQARMPGLRVVPVVLPPALAHAGEARRLALAEAVAISAPDGVLLTTDADTHAPPHWVAANLAALAGVDAVAGRAVIDPIEARLIPRHLHELDALECTYAALLDEIEALLKPDRHDPWPRHDEHSGASIAVRLPAYLAAGGMPRQPTGEDRAFFDSLRRTGARIRHAPEVWVTVSGRLDGRAKGGMADTIRSRMHQAPEWLDDRLEPVDDRLHRLTGPRDAAPAPMRRVKMAGVASQIARATHLRDQLRGLSRLAGSHSPVASLSSVLRSAARLLVGGVRPVFE